MAQVLTVPRLFVKAYWYESYRIEVTPERIEEIRVSHEVQIQNYWNRYLSMGFTHKTNETEEIFKGYRKWIEVFQLADND